MVRDVDGGGGVERFYINFIRLRAVAKEQVDIITTTKSRKAILRLYPDMPPERIKAFPVLSNRFSHQVSGLYLWTIIRLRGYSLVHIANFDAYFLPLYERLSHQVKLTLNIIDCRFAPEFEHPRYTAIKRFIASGHLSGIFSWYENPEAVVKQLAGPLPFHATHLCFTDYSRFKKEQKEPTVVFAARLSDTKRPDHYLAAVQHCFKKDPALANRWKFLLWGDGEGKATVTRLIEELGLSEKVLTGFSADMSTIFNHSSIFVSTQLYENFTSLSMLEAMASGNAIVSYNVGQTGLFVRDGVNGLLVHEEQPEALAEALYGLLSSPGLLTTCQEQSAAMARQVHTVDNFSEDLFYFWKSCLHSSHDQRRF